MIRLRYRPTTLFHFKRLDATNKAALTLPMPTPYAVRVALLAVSDDPDAAFPAVQAKQIIVTPAPLMVVNQCWVKILDLRRKDKGWTNPDATSEYQSTMSMREYAYIPSDGTADLSIYINSLEGIEELPARINYFGKRGGFVQFLGQDEAEPPPASPHGVIYELEDFAADATWDKVNVHTESRPPRERFLQTVPQPVVIHGTGHALYQF